jgi:zinc transporter ZupT
MRWRLWALVPAILLVGVVSATVAAGDSLDGLVGNAPPPADEFDVRRVEFAPGTISIHITNPQREHLTLAQVTVDDAIVPFSIDGVQGARTLGRLESATVSVPFFWVEDDPYAIGLISSTGIVTTHDVPAAVATEQPSLHGAVGLAVIGVLVGVVPIALGLAWLPSLRRASPRSLAAFMALTAGLLTFLMVEALAEALELQARLPGALNGTGLVVLGVASSYLGLTLVASRLSGSGSGLGGVGLATLVAIGIGVHNLGEGLAIGSSLALGELALGAFLIVGFMVHNVTEGLGISAPIAERGMVSLRRLAVLALIAGAPAVLGAWIGGFLTNDLLRCCSSAWPRAPRSRWSSRWGATWPGGPRAVSPRARSSAATSPASWRCTQRASSRPSYTAAPVCGPLARSRRVDEYSRPSSKNGGKP